MDTKRRPQTLPSAAAVAVAVPFGTVNAVPAEL